MKHLKKFTAIDYDVAASANSEEVIGDTDGYGPSKSGKNAIKIYNNFNNPAHLNFDDIDHEAAAAAHGTHMFKIRSKMFPNKEYLSQKQKSILEQDKDYIFHKTQQELHYKKSQELYDNSNKKKQNEKSFNDRIKKEKEQQKLEKIFKKEVWKKIPIEERNLIEQCVARLDQLKQYHPLDTPGGSSTVKEQRASLKAKIKKIEDKYYQKYRNMFDVLTSKKLSDFDSKTGLFT